MSDPATLPNGSAITFGVEDPLNPGTFIELGCQKDSDWEEARAAIDVSCKDARAMTVRPGQYSGSWSIELVYNPADPAYVICRDHVRGGETLARILRTEDGAAVEEIDVLITSLSHTAPYEDAATVSISADTSGEWADAV